VAEVLDGGSALGRCHEAEVDKPELHRLSSDREASGEDFSEFVFAVDAALAYDEFEGYMDQ
jgi:hypothetical protein